jgi:hypothetical protein
MLLRPHFAAPSRAVKFVLRTSLSLAAALAGIAVVTYVRPETYSWLFGERDVAVTSDVAYGAAPRQRLHVSIRPKVSPSTMP